MPQLKSQMTEIFLQVADALIDGLGNAVGWVLIGLLAFIADTYRRIRKNSRRLNKLDRYVTGDTDDPDSPGLLQRVDDVGGEVNEMKGEMKTQHRQTDRKLDRLLGQEHDRQDDDRSPPDSEPGSGR